MTPRLPRAAEPHGHDFLGAHHDRNSRRTVAVIALTAVVMAAEIAAGAAFGSLALLADGWHMGTHVAALSISVAAYALARRFQRDPRFTFGTGKFGDLAGFASAIALGLTALLIAWEALERLQAPVPIAFGEALAVAVIGLAVNLASAWLLGGHGHGHNGHHHGHEDHGDHAHGQHSHAEERAATDNNLRAAYLHVLADALTSVLAILSLLAGWFVGWTWLDPAMAAVGAAVIAAWSVGLARRTAFALLDADAPPELAQRVRDTIEAEGDRISDLHLWRVGPGCYAAILVVVSPEPRPSDAYRARLAGYPMLRHVTVEVARAA
ncbi:CDF family Co(II)/Ni(II) efflux transporter DmeF [Craurococcus roseus]|uniref:CDF family Co(II)/Ni(II) efflux transporter DmeF n=1 Tax=Craurococcus roseus TaxID=77585 RepID=A0ABN1EMH2_9PROT